MWFFEARIKLNKGKNPHTHLKSNTTFERLLRRCFQGSVSERKVHL